jgi:hypothetical protein
MENYYFDSRVMQALEKSSEELMDILTFVKEIDFEIRDREKMKLRSRYDITMPPWRHRDVMTAKGRHDRDSQRVFDFF